MAAQRLRARQASRSTEERKPDFLAAVPQLSPNLTAPVWISPLADVLERAYLAACGLGPPVRACVNVPSQHGKTELIKAAIAIWLKYRPQDPILYATYNRQTAKVKSGQIRDLARTAGVKLRSDSRSLEDWSTAEGGGLRARALVGGAITGMEGLQFVVIDDPYKDRRDADSPAMRRHVWNAFTDSVFSRLHAQTSILINHTRWHERDLTGSLKKPPPELAIDSSSWEFVNVPAVEFAGEGETLAEQIESMRGPLWPERQPLELLKEKRSVNEHSFWSIYMGEPRPRGGKVFSGVSYYDALPSSMNVSIGVDLAYTSKTSAHWSVAVVMGESSGRYYVIDVVTRQCEADKFAHELRDLARRWPGAPMRMYVGDAEKGGPQVMQALGVPLHALRAADLGDKFARAQPMSTAWNLGLISVPQSAPWVRGYLDAVQDFTGVGDDVDEVDASVSAFDALPRTGIRPRVDTTVRAPEPQRPRRDPALLTRGRNKLGVW